MGSKSAVGAKYENLAEGYLRGRGYRFVGRNFRIRGGEIDLIFEDWSANSGVLVLVEVRMRDPRSFVSPEESITGTKALRLKRAAVVYLSRYRGGAKEVRFDLIAIRGDSIHHHCDFIGD